MTISILIPHWRTLKMTAYTVSQFLKYKGDHDVKIIVIDNSYPDESIKGLEPFRDQITILPNTSTKTSSHGIALDMAMELVDTPYVLTAESDSFPIRPGYLDYYQQIIDGGFQMAGSLLTLSGGSYIHPAACLYSRNLWQQCKEYCDSIPYAYFPAMMLRDNFNLHTMIHNDYLDQVLENPEDWFELSSDYKPYSKEKTIKKMEHYKPVCGPFHDGRGGRQENIRTFGGRTWLSEVPFATYNPKWQKIIGRIGLEPGQFLHYFACSQGTKIFEIPTEIKWMPGKEHQQQEYTINEPGIKHLWGISAYHNYTPENEKDVAKFKQSIPEQLYATLPPNQRIK